VKEFDAVACQPVIHEVAATLRPFAEAKGLTFDLVMPAQDVWVRTDRRALKQILLNLTNNAIKFTERGIVRLEVVKPDPGARAVEIRVIDTGTGIRPEDQQRLFGAFTQLETMTRRSEGTGLGLHLSQKLAELLGGSIRFTSAFGEGSTFVLSLPRS
jgi:signal transduction histidine kinase